MIIIIEVAKSYHRKIFSIFLIHIITVDTSIQYKQLRVFGHVVRVTDAGRYKFSFIGSIAKVLTVRGRAEANIKKNAIKCHSLVCQKDTW